MANLKTGKEIVDAWYGQKEFKAFKNITEKTSFTDLEDKIDAALQEARAEGEIAGWEKAFIMVKLSFSKKTVV